jgi:hypothetical protein
MDLLGDRLSFSHIDISFLRRNPVRIGIPGHAKVVVFSDIHAAKPLLSRITNFV